MSINYYEPTYDTNLDQFIGTDLWILMTFPSMQDIGVIDAYMNLIKRDGDLITYHILSGEEFNKPFWEISEDIDYDPYIVDEIMNRIDDVRTFPYDELRFVPVEPLTFITTEELLGLVGVEE